MIDLMALAAVDRETEVTYIRQERDWAQRAAEAGRFIDADRLLPMLPPSIAAPGRRRQRQRPWQRPRPRHGHGARRTAAEPRPRRTWRVATPATGTAERRRRCRSPTPIPFLVLAWDDVLFVVLAAMMLVLGARWS